MQNLISTLLLLALTFSSCKKTEEEPITMEDIARAAERGDTVVVKGGQTMRLRIEAKYDTVNTVLNGRVVFVYGTNNGKYSYDLDGKVSQKMFKPSVRTDSLKISIRSDSIKIGDNFKGWIWLKQENYRILLTSPYQNVMDIHTNDLDDDTIEISYQCNEAGESKFEGDIEYSSGKRVHFIYRFIVER